jgi:hypothetical protein
MPGLGQNELLSMSQQFSGLPMDSLIGGPLNAAATANGSMAVNQVRFMLDTCFKKVLVPAVAASAAGATPVVAAQDEYYNYLPIMINMSLTRQVITPVSASASKAYADAVHIAAVANAAVPPPNPPVTPTIPEPKADIQNITTAFNLPLLTIIPLNSLAVQTVNINFEMEVKSSYGEDHSNESSKSMAAEASFEAKVNYGIFSASVKGSASTKSEEKSSESSHYEKSNSAKYTVAVTAGQIPLPGGVKTIIDAFAGAINPMTLPVPA